MKMLSSCSRFITVLFPFFHETLKEVLGRMFPTPQKWIVTYTAKLQKGQKLMRTYFNTGTVRQTHSANCVICANSFGQGEGGLEFRNRCKIAIRLEVYLFVDFNFSWLNFFLQCMAL